MVSTRQRRLNRAGIVCLLLSFSRWALLLLVPLLPLTASRRWSLGISIVVIAEIFFWIGIALVGKELARRYLRRFNLSSWWSALRRRWRG